MSFQFYHWLKSATKLWTNLNLSSTTNEISELAESNNKVNLNMRVGIHSGRVLCGILGKKRYQYDVHSNDVFLANRTEQSGCPGRVHITEPTLVALNNSYEVEEAFGHQRDPDLEKINMRTYFVIPPADRKRTSNISFTSSNSLSSDKTASGPLAISGSDLVTRENLNKTVKLNIKDPQSSQSQQQPRKQRFKQASQRLINAMWLIRTVEAPFAHLNRRTEADVEREIDETIVSRCRTQDICTYTLKFKDEKMGHLYGRHWTRVEWAKVGLYLLYTILLMFLLMLTCYPLNGGESSQENDQKSAHLRPTMIVHFMVVFLITLSVYVHQTEHDARCDFLWRENAAQNIKSISELTDCNRKIFHNLLPPHVADYFLEQKTRTHMVS